jgi:hypothetical protein
MKSNYPALSNHLIESNLDRLQLTVEQIAGIVDGLPESAYIHATMWYEGSIFKAAQRAGYLISKSGENVTFFKGVKQLPHSATKTHSRQVTRLNTILEIGEAVSNIHTYHDTTEEGVHTRYRSWVYCFIAFRDNRHDLEQINYLCLHLAWYLASWGMLRNSFLLNRDYLVHESLVRTLLSGKFEALFHDNYSDDNIHLVMEASNAIRESYSGGSVTPTLITKILLGVFGCCPAYDDFFIYAARKYRVCSGTWGMRSLTQLWYYYEDHRNEL